MSNERNRKDGVSKYRDNMGSFRSSMPRWTDMGNVNDGYGGYEYLDPWGQMGLKYAPQYCHNEPVRRHARSSENSSSGDDTDSNVLNEKPIKGRLQGHKIALIVIVAGLVAIAAAITVILVLSLKPAESQPNRFRVVTMSVSVAETFKSEYKNQSSLEYKLFAGNFTSAMDEIFQANNTKGYKGTQIVELKTGSVIVIFTVVIEFKQSEGSTGEEVLKAVITGQKTYVNDSNSVVIKNFIILKASLLIVKTEELASNPISTTAEPMTTSTTATKATATTSITSPSPGPKNFSVATVNLAVNDTFKPEYNNTSSVEYQTFAADFTNAMDKIFNTTEGYKGIQIKELKNGSVIVIFIIVIEVKQNVIPLGAEELKAVITGQEKDANDNTTVVIGRLRILTTNVSVVAIDKVVANPLSPTASSTTTKTSTSTTTFQPAASTTVQANITTSTISTSNLHPNASTTTSTLAVITTPTTTSTTLQPSTTTTSTSTSTTTATTTRTSPGTSEPIATSTTLLTSATTSITNATPPASSSSIESNMTTTILLISSTTSMSTTSIATTQTSLSPSTISTLTSTTTSTSTTANTTSPNTPELKANSTTLYSSTSTSMPTTTGTISPQTIEQSSTTSTSTSPATRTPATASSTTLKTPEPNATNIMISTSSTILTPTTISTSLTKAQEPNTTNTTSTTITNTTTTLMTSTKILELSTTSFNPSTISTTLSSTPVSILTNTTASTTTAVANATSSISSTKLSEPSTTSTTTPASTTSLKSTTIISASPKPPETNVTTAATSTSTTMSIISTNSTASPKTSEANMTSSTTSTTKISLKPTTNNTTLSNTPTPFMTSKTASTTGIAANVTTPSISSTKPPEPNMTSVRTSISTTSYKTTSTATPTPTTSLKSNTVSTTSPKSPEPNTTTASTSITASSIVTNSTNTPTPMTTTTTPASTTDPNVTSSISSTKSPEPSMTSTSTLTSTTNIKPTTISNTSKFLETNTTTATTSTSTTTSNVTTNITTSPKPTEANMTSTATSTTTIFFKPTTNVTMLSTTPTTIMATTTALKSTSAPYITTTSISSTKPPEMNTTITAILTLTTSLIPATISNITPKSPEPNTTIATPSTSRASSSISTYSITSPKSTEMNMTSTTSSILITTLNPITTNISLTKITEMSTTIPSTLTSTTTLMPTTTSAILPSTPEPNATNATPSTSTYTTKPSSSAPTTMVTSNISSISMVPTNSTMEPSIISATTIVTTTTTTTGVAFNMKYYTAVVGVSLQLICTVTGWNGNLSISRLSRGNQQEVKVVNFVYNETVTILNGFAVNRTFAGYNVNVYIFILNVSCEDEGSYYCTSGGVSDNATVKQLPEKPTIQIPDIMIQDGYNDVNSPFVCQGEVEDPGGKLITEVNKNGTFYLYKAFGEVRNNNNTACGLMQIYKFYIDGRFTKDWDNAKIRCAAINNMTGVESGVRQISEEKTIRLLPADTCTGVPPGSNISYPYSGCDLYLTCQANTPLLGKCPQGFCFFDNVRACHKLECPFVHCNDTEVAIGKSASINCDIFFCGSSFSLAINHSQETLFREMNISNQILRTIGNMTVHIVIRNGSALVNLSFLETKCNDSGEYIIDLNGRSFTDRAYLTLKVPTKIPTLTLSQSVMGCTESTISCTGELGFPQESMYLEVNFKGGNFTKYDQTSLRTDKKECSNTGNLEMKFIAGDKWNGAQVRCVTGNKTETRMESNVQLINISSSGVCFSPDEYIGYLNDTVQLNCTVTGLSAGDIVTFSRVTSANDTEKIMSKVEFGKVPSYNISGIYIRAVPLSANDSIFVLTIVSVSCGDRGTYFCKVGNRQASARFKIWQKPGTPILTMSRLIFENKYMQTEYPLVCEGEVGYPSGKMMVEVNTNGSYTKYTYFQISSVIRVSDAECSTYETLKFSIPELVSMTLNNTLMRCVSTNDITLTSNESPPTSLLQRIYVVQDSFCSNLNNGNYRHPYECTMYISCTNHLVTPQTCANQCANTTGTGSIACVNCSTVRCKDQEGFMLTTTAATTTEKPACPYVRCDSIQGRLNNSATIHCQLLFCGETFTLSVMSVGINITNRVNDTFSTTQNNVKVLVDANQGAAALNIIFNSVECSSAGTYNVSIDDGAAFDLPNLEVNVYPETPTLTIPTNMYENQRTTATCTAKLGDPPALLYLERMPVGGQYARLGESFSVNISKGNCSNIGQLDTVFYPNSTWNGSKLSCVAERPDILQRFRSDEKVTVIKSPKLYFTKTSYSEFVGSSTRLTCVAKEMSSADLQTIIIERYISSGGNEFVSSIFINGTVKNVIVNVSISNESYINSSSASVHIDFHYLSCSDMGNYYCIAGGFSAKGTLDILRKPGIPTFNMSKYIYENKYMLSEYPMVCEGEVGYPSGKMGVEAYTNGSFVEYQYYEISRQIRISEDTCSTHEILQFAVPGLVPLALNNTAIRCVATNNITITSNESPPTSERKRLYVVPVSFCNGSRTGDFKHPYECTFFISCTTGDLAPRNCFDKCANMTSSGAQCIDCSQVNCTNPDLIVDTTTAITTTTKVTCPAVRCDDAYASLNESKFIECRIKYCGPTFDFSIISENLKLQNSTSGNFSRVERNAQVKIYADSGDARLRIIFDPVKCINAGMYNVSIDSGIAFGFATLHVQVFHEMPTLIIPSEIYENQRASIYCIAQLGNPPGSLQIEISSSGKPAITFDSLINITRGNCSNIGRVDVELYPNSLLNGSNITCRANGPNNQGLSLLDEKTIVIKSPKIYFANASNSGFIGSSTRLTCQIKEMSSTDLQTVIITRDSTPGATEFVASLSMNRTIVGAFQNVSISSESLISSSGATIHVDFYNLRCTDERNYYCTAGTSSAKGALQVFRKPKILEFRFPTGILENANPGTFNCTAEKGYPAGRVVIEINKNGTFVEAPFILNRNNVTSDACSNIEIVTFSYSFTSTWNKTAIQCKAENERTLGPNDAPPSVIKNVLVVPADICQALNYLYIPHPYECHKFILCGTGTYVYDCPLGTCRFTVPSNRTYCDTACNNCTDFGT